MVFATRAYFPSGAIVFDILKTYVLCTVCKFEGKGVHRYECHFKDLYEYKDMEVKRPASEVMVCLETENEEEGN